MNKDKVLAEVRERADHALEAWSENFARMEEDIEFLDGKQWPDDIIDERNDEGRPVLTFNKLPTYVDQVTGEQRQMRPAIKVFPAQGDAGDDRVKNFAGTKDYSKAEVYGGLIRNIEYESAADIAYDTAFEHQAAHGMGFFRIITEYADEGSFDQQFKIMRIRNWRSVLPDPAFEEPDGSDMGWCMIFTKLHKNEFDRRWPKKDRVEISIHKGDEYARWVDGDYVRVAEYYRKIPEKKTLYLLSDGRIIEDESILDELEQMGITVKQTRQIDCDKVEWMKVSGADILEGPIETVFHAIPVIPVLGKELVVNGDIYYRGVVRHAKDPQRMYNYWRTATTEAVALQPKVPYVISDKQLEGYQDYWDQANQRNLPYLPYKYVQGEPQPRREMPPQVPAGMVNETVMADQDIRATMGMFESDIGEPSNEKSGRAIMARQQQGDTNNFTFSDNMVRSIRHAGRLLVRAIPQVYDTERIVRIRFPDDAEDFVPINQTILDEQTGEEVVVHDLSVGKFDVLVKSGPSYSTQRQEAIDAMAQILQANPNLWNVIGDLIAKNMDWPGADEFAERLKKMIPKHLLDEAEAQDIPDPQPTPDQQVEMAKSQAEMAKAQAEMKKAEATEAKAGADIEGVRADIAKAQADMMQAMEQIQSLEENVKDAVAEAIAQALIGMQSFQPQSGGNP